MKSQRLSLTRPVLVLGAGGHAGVVTDMLRQDNRELVGLVSPQVDIKLAVLQGITHYTNDDDVLSFDSNEICLVNGLGSLPGNALRHRLYDKFSQLGYQFETVIAQSAIISPYAELGEGVQVMPRAVIMAGAKVGANSIINTGAIIEHDCQIGANNHIAPGATLSGGVTTKDNVHIGTGAVVIQAVTINKSTTIGAGAVVTGDIDECTIVYPAKGFKKVVK
jgi:sugar O-acyltransferase (sialic acid O-acetyltransferase NeuD family)